MTAETRDRYAARLDGLPGPAELVQHEQAPAGQRERNRRQRQTDDQSQYHLYLRCSGSGHAILT